MTFYFQVFGWSVFWQLCSFDPVRCLTVIARLSFAKGGVDRWGWMARWDQRPDWKHFPTTAALRIERMKSGKTVAYVFRGPIERIPRTGF